MFQVLFGIGEKKAQKAVSKASDVAGDVANKAGDVANKADVGNVADKAGDVAQKVCCKRSCAPCCPTLMAAIAVLLIAHARLDSHGCTSGRAVRMPTPNIQILSDCLPWTPSHNSCATSRQHIPGCDAGGREHAQQLQHL